MADGNHLVQIAQSHHIFRKDDDMMWYFLVLFIDEVSLYTVENLYPFFQGVSLRLREGLHYAVVCDGYRRMAPLFHTVHNIFHRH